MVGREVGLSVSLSSASYLHMLSQTKKMCCNERSSPLVVGRTAMSRGNGNGMCEVIQVEAIKGNVIDSTY